MSIEPRKDVARNRRGLRLLAAEPSPTIPPPADAAEDGDGSPELGPDSRHDVLSAILESAPDCIVLFDREGKILEWNAAAESILGFHRGEALGHDIVKLIFPERTRSAIRSVINQHGDGWGRASSRQIEIAVLRADGEEIPVELTMCWAEGPAAFAAHLRDASERSERERQLSTEARRRSTVLDLGQVALEGLGLDELMNRVIAAAVEEIGFDRCEVWELAPDGEHLVLRAAHGWNDIAALGSQIVPEPGSQLARALRSDDRAVLFEDLPGLSSSRASVRIAGHEGPFGVLSGSTGGDRRYTSTDGSHLESLAHLLASAIDRDHYDRSLTEAEEQVRTLVERLPSIVYRAGLGSEGRWHFVSPQVEEILGFTVAECLEDNFWWEKRIHPDDLERVIATEEACAANGTPLDIEYRMIAREGNTIWIRDRASIGERSEAGEVIVEGLFTDITDQKQAEERLRYLADHDDMTGLLNRRGFEAEVERECDDPGWATRGGAVAIINLDHLKRINDALGHAAGDEILCEVAERVSEALLPGEVFGRLSGDEFGLLLPGADRERAGARVGQLLALIRSQQGQMTLTASAGVATSGAAGAVAVPDLMVAADVALYQAKEGGRDRVAYFSGEDRAGLEWVALVREAVDRGLLLLNAQPIVDVATGEHYADELLVRMRGPDGEPVPAGQFVPTAERFGLIRDVDRWVVNRAVDLAASGRRVNVNISAASLADPELTRMIGERIDAKGADPGLLTFEITETVATPTIEALREFAGRIDGLGCGLSLDDVGTGFGSLTYLQNLNFTQLKIDMQFIRGILDSPTDLRIVRSIVLIGQELGMRTVAEGVESAEVLAKLGDLGVDYAQGYHLGRAEPVGIDRA